MSTATTSAAIAARRGVCAPCRRSGGRANGGDGKRLTAAFEALEGFPGWPSRAIACWPWWRRTACGEVTSSPIESDVALGDLR